MSIFYKVYKLDREENSCVPFSVKTPVAEVYMEEDDTLVELPFVQKQSQEIFVYHHKPTLKEKPYLYVRYK